MIRMPVDRIIAKIKEESGVSEEEIRAKIRNKLEELSGLISEEGAAHIIANELKVKLYDQSSGKLKITNILSGMRNVETVGKVQTVYPVNEFTRKDGAKGKVASMWIADDSSSIRVAMWGDHADKSSELSEGSIVQVKGCYVKDNNGKPELHLNDKSELIINPEGEKIEKVAERTPVTNTRKKISELSEGMSNVELLTTIVQLFEIRFFEMCPDCNKRVRQRGEDSFVCDEHGIVKPYYSYVMNAFLDDGSDTIRSVFWAKQVQALLGKDDGDIQSMKDDQTAIDLLKNSLMGKIVKIAGSVKRNKMFDRLEFNVFEVDADPDPGVELKRYGVVDEVTGEPVKAAQPKEVVPSIMDLEESGGDNSGDDNNSETDSETNESEVEGTGVSSEKSGQNIDEEKSSGEDDEKSSSLF